MVSFACKYLMYYMFVLPSCEFLLICLCCKSDFTVMSVALRIFRMSHLRSLLFWDFMQHRTVDTDILGQPVDPIFKGQAAQEDCLTLEDGVNCILLRVALYQQWHIWNSRSAQYFLQRTQVQWKAVSLLQLVSLVFFYFLCMQYILATTHPIITVCESWF